MEIGRGGDREEDRERVRKIVREICVDTTRRGRERERGLLVLIDY